MGFARTRAVGAGKAEKLEKLEFRLAPLVGFARMCAWLGREPLYGGKLFLGERWL